MKYERNFGKQYSKQVCIVLNSCWFVERKCIVFDIFGHSKHLKKHLYDIHQNNLSMQIESIII